MAQTPQTPTRVSRRAGAVAAQVLVGRGPKCRRVNCMGDRWFRAMTNWVACRTRPRPCCVDVLPSDDDRSSWLCSLAPVGVLNCPDRCLRSVSNADLSQDCFQMNFDGRFRQMACAGDGLVGVTGNEELQNLLLSGRQLCCMPAVHSWLMFAETAGFSFGLEGVKRHAVLTHNDDPLAENCEMQRFKQS